MTIIRGNPWREARTLRQAMNELFEDSFVPPREGQLERTERRLRLPLDVYTTPEEIVIIASVPRVEPDAVDVTIDDDRLTIRGELRPPLENVDYLFQERAYGPFSRTLALNVPVETGEAEAVFESGVLRLTLPKAEESKPKTIEVKRK